MSNLEDTELYNPVEREKPHSKYTNPHKTTNVGVNKKYNVNCIQLYKRVFSIEKYNPTFSEVKTHR